MDSVRLSRRLAVAAAAAAAICSTALALPGPALAQGQEPPPGPPGSAAPRSGTEGTDGTDRTEGTDRADGHAGLTGLTGLAEEGTGEAPSSTGPDADPAAPVGGADPAPDGPRPAPDAGRAGDRAAPAGRIRLTPSSVEPGGELDLKLDGCADRNAVAKSEAFVTDARLAPTAGGELSAEATVRSTAPAGSYGVTVECGGRPAFAESTVEVSGDRRADASPTAPVRAGGGGTAGERPRDEGATPIAASADDSGPGTRQTIVGVGLAGAAGLAVAGIAARRRRSGSAADGSAGD
ncbi:hypothetical protein [Streptomyces sp. URMC 123]|uniref:hypothetical protein n=1 Tax=Streptomyces sp. URMC 123 TaxID=3423403 RepID=UPI003F1C3FB6